MVNRINVTNRNVVVLEYQRSTQLQAQAQSPYSPHPHTSTLCWATRPTSLPSRAGALELYLAPLAATATAPPAMAVSYYYEKKVVIYCAEKVRI